LSDTELLTLLARKDATPLVADGLIRLAQRRGLPVGIQAAFELCRRMHQYTPAPREPVDVALLARSLIAEYGMRTQEHLGAVLLDARRRVLRLETIYVGTVNSALVSTRDVLQRALAYDASSIILFHNHPSGTPDPSAEDLTYTRKLRHAADLLDVRLDDHLIITRDTHYSLRDHGDL
jgi:DNA repair protein RadC